MTDTPAALPPTVPPTLPGPIAYLTGEYPRATDTFIQREVAGLRALGAQVLTCSVRATDAAHHVGEEQKREHANTFQVQRTAKSPVALAKAHIALLRAVPKRWFGAAALAWRTRPPGLKALLWQLFYFLEAGVLAAEMRARGAVHLHNHFGNSSCSVAMIAAHMADLPYSYTMHGPAEFFEPTYWRIDAKIARASFVSCISHFSRAQGMIFADQKHWPKMRIVHCGVDPALYDGAGQGAQNGDAPQLLFVGRLAAIKGVALLLEAFADLRARHPKAGLTLVGDGPERAALEAKARDLGLGDSVRFTGYLGQSDVAAELLKTDVFVLPSFAEGVPVVLMEAMAARRPVIAPRVAGVQELVEDGISGYTVPPGDLETLTARIETLLGDVDLRRRMGHAGRAKVVAEFDAKHEAAWLLQLMAASLGEGLPEGLRPAAAQSCGTDRKLT